MRPTARWARVLRAVTTVAITIESTACYSAEDFDKALGTGQLCTTKDAVAGIRLQPRELTLPVGGTSQLTATLSDPNGGTFLLCPPLTIWSSSNAGIARALSAGVGTAGGGVLAVAPGTTYIAARAGGQADSVKVTVIPAS